MVRFLKEDLTPGTNDPNPIIIAQQNANVDYINRNLNTLEKELAKEKLRFSGLKNLCEALQAADEEVERVMSQLLEVDEVFPYQTIRSAFSFNR